MNYIMYANCLRANVSSSRTPTAAITNRHSESRNFLSHRFPERKMWFDSLASQKWKMTSQDQPRPPASWARGVWACTLVSPGRSGRRGVKRAPAPHERVGGAGGYAAGPARRRCRWMCSGRQRGDRYHLPLQGLSRNRLGAALALSTLSYEYSRCDISSLLLTFYMNMVHLLQSVNQHWYTIIIITVIIIII